MTTLSQKRPMRVSESIYRKLQARSAALYARELERWNGNASGSSWLDAERR